MNGWTLTNGELRRLLLSHYDADFISLNETHLKGQSSIEIEGYTWFGMNRKTHFRAPKGSGGVGVLVKNSIFGSYKVNVFDNIFGCGWFTDDSQGIRLLFCYFLMLSSP